MLGGMATRKKHRRVSYLLREEEGRFCARVPRAPSVMATLLSRWDPPLSGIRGVRLGTMRLECGRARAPALVAQMLRSVGCLEWLRWAGIGLASTPWR